MRSGTLVEELFENILCGKNLLGCLTFILCELSSPADVFLCYVLNVFYDQNVHC